jgi:anti-sigma B factor antagonist
MADMASIARAAAIRIAVVIVMGFPFYRSNSEWPFRVRTLRDSHSVRQNARVKIARMTFTALLRLRSGDRPPLPRFDLRRAHFDPAQGQHHPEEHPGCPIFHVSLLSRYGSALPKRSDPLVETSVAIFRRRTGMYIQGIKPMAAFSSKLEIQMEQITKDTYEIKLVGELGMGSVNSLDRVIKSIFEQGIYRIIIDLTGMYYIASSGLGILSASTELAREKGGEFIFVGVIPKVKHVFELVGMTRILKFAATEKEGLELLKKSA